MLDDTLEKALQKHFGFSSFRAPQKEIMSSILYKKDTVAILPTGQGKSLCFQLPSLLFPFMTVVISPLLALMQDQVLTLQKKGVHAAALTSDLTKQQRALLFQQIHLNNIKFLHLSPEQLHNPHTQKVLLQSQISHLCVDEAHCVSQWGHDFRPEYTKIDLFLRHYTQHHPRPILSAFTATASIQVFQDILSHFPLINPQVFALDYYRDNLDYIIVPINSEAEKRRLWQEILEFWHQHQLGKCLVYASTRIDTEFYTFWAQKYGFPAQAFHAGLSSMKRQKILNTYQQKSTGLLIATTAFGMGIDIPDIRIVVHLSPPTNLSAYAQESGRAGRDQKRSWCIFFFRAEDLAKNYDLFLSPQPHQRLQQQREAYTVHQWIKNAPCYSQSLAQYFHLHGVWRPRNLACACTRCSTVLPWRNATRQKTIIEDHQKKKS